MPKQWRLIALYMVLAYLAFVVAINIAKREVIADEQRAQGEKPL